jgi:hypothetical protein
MCVLGILLYLDCSLDHTSSYEFGFSSFGIIFGSNLFDACDRHSLFSSSRRFKKRLNSDSPNCNENRGPMGNILASYSGGIGFKY